MKIWVVIVETGIRTPMFDSLKIFKDYEEAVEHIISFESDRSNSPSALRTSIRKSGSHSFNGKDGYEYNLTIHSGEV